MAVTSEIKLVYRGKSFFFFGNMARISHVLDGYSLIENVRLEHFLNKVRELQTKQKSIGVNWKLKLVMTCSISVTVFIGTLLAFQN